MHCHGLAGSACPRAGAQPECASRKKPTDSRERVFFIRPQALEATSKNALSYDDCTSGAIIYAYVGGNPLTGIDPLGLEKVILIPMREVWTFAAALTYPDNDGMLTIISHGSLTTVNMKSPAQLAALIKNLPSWKAGDRRPVLLNACNTGAGGENSYAAKLNKELGMPVTAPTTQTWNVGPFDIGPFNSNSAGDAPNLRSPGFWVTFGK